MGEIIKCVYSLIVLENILKVLYLFVSNLANFIPLYEQ